MKVKVVSMILLFAFCSCGEYEVLEVQKECKRVADSLFRAHKDSILVELNKDCSTTGPIYYEKVLDSLKDARIKDIKNLLEK